jgi:hypothetical protein
MVYWKFIWQQDEMGANSNAFRGWRLCHAAMATLALGSLAYILVILTQQAQQWQSGQLIAVMRR